MAISYFGSSEVHVFPCAYRSPTYDPEARLNTEDNIVNIGGNGIQKSYIISYDAGSTGVADKLICVIGGYYFEITGTDQNSLKTTIGNNYLAIRTTETHITGSTGPQTAILANFDTGFIGALDTDSPATFKGLAITNNISNATAYIHPFIGGLLNYAEFLPTNLKSGSGGSENTPKSLIFGDNNTNSGSNSIVIGEHLSNVTNDALIIGKYNAATNNLFTVSNGDSTTSHDAFEVKTNEIKLNENTSITGNTSVSGTVTIGGNSTIGGNVSIAAGKTLTTNAIYSHGGLSDSVVIKQGSAAPHGITVGANNITIAGDDTTHSIVCGSSNTTINGATAINGAVTIDGSVTISNNVTNILKAQSIQSLTNGTSTIGTNSKYYATGYINTINTNNITALTSGSDIAVKSSAIFESGKTVYVPTIKTRTDSTADGVLGEVAANKRWKVCGYLNKEEISDLSQESTGNPASLLVATLGAWYLVRIHIGSGDQQSWLSFHIYIPTSAEGNGVSESAIITHNTGTTVSSAKYYKVRATRTTDNRGKITLYQTSNPLETWNSISLVESTHMPRATLICK